MITEGTKERITNNESKERRTTDEDHQGIGIGAGRRLQNESRTRTPRPRREPNEVDSLPLAGYTTKNEDESKKKNADSQQILIIRVPITPHPDTRTRERAVRHAVGHLSAFRSKEKDKGKEEETQELGEALQRIRRSMTRNKKEK